MGQTMLSGAAEGTPRSPQRGSAVMERGIQARWDGEVVADIASIDYVRAVVFTDGQGRIVDRLGRMELSRDEAEVLDISLANLEQTGRALGMGELQVGVSIFASGIVLSATSRDLRVSVLAHGTANLGQLLSQVRRIFVASHG